jgi:Cd2+/Zn2+-exporting ATPase
MTLAAFSSVLLGSGMEGALLLVLFETSSALESTVTRKAQGAISRLHRLSPGSAHVVKEDETLLERSVKDIHVGTTILVRAGEIVPLDGKILSGTTQVSLMHLTGENLPVTKAVGDELPAGAVNGEGAVTLQVTRTDDNSTVARIIRLVTQAKEARPRLQRWFDRLSRTYATSIITISLGFATIVPLIGHTRYFGPTGSIYRALTFLIAASPCALIIAIPIAYLSAVSVCARQGILLKGGITLDALAGCTTVAFDKTGTLTLGKLKCVGVEPMDGNALSDTEATAVAAALERGAVHPVARAIIEEAEKKQLDGALVKDFKATAGYGVEGSVKLKDTWVKSAIGSPEFIFKRLPKDKNALIKEKVEKIRASGEVFAAGLIENDIWLFRFQDTLRPQMAHTIKELKEKHRWRLLMLTGDHPASAGRIAGKLGIEEFFADLKPEDKLTHVSLLAEKEGLAMVGDGINDAPALARATVGICMGKVGSTTAVDAADVILLHDNLERLPWLLDKSKQTQNIVRQNLCFAAAAILGATIPALMGLIPLWLAVVLHEGGTIAVGLNALRLVRK